LFLKLKAGFQSKGLYDEGFNVESMTVFLIVNASMTILMFSCTLMHKTAGVVDDLFTLPVNFPVHRMYDVFHGKNKEQLKVENHVFVCSMDFDSESKSEDVSEMHALYSFWQLVVKQEKALQHAVGASKNICLHSDPTLRIQRCAIVSSPLRFYSFFAKFSDLRAKLEGPSRAAFELDYRKEDARISQQNVIAHIGIYPEFPISKHSGHPQIEYPKMGVGMFRSFFKKQHRHTRTPTGTVRWDSGKVRTMVAFSVVPDEKTAKSVLAGNLIVMQSRDAGYYGAGLYMSFDAEYAVHWYARKKRKAEDGRTTIGMSEELNFPVNLMVYAVVIGNVYPVVTKGKPGAALVRKADSHVVVLDGAWNHNNQKNANDGMGYPVDPVLGHDGSDEKGGGDTGINILRTELVLRDDSQVFPLGYFILQDKVGIPVVDIPATGCDIADPLPTQTHKKQFRNPLSFTRSRRDQKCWDEAAAGAPIRCGDTGHTTLHGNATTKPTTRVRGWTIFNTPESGDTSAKASISNPLHEVPESVSNSEKATFFSANTSFFRKKFEQKKMREQNAVS